MKRNMTLDEAAGILAMDREAVRKLAKDGELDSCQESARVRTFEKTHVLNYLKAQVEIAKDTLAASKRKLSEAKDRLIALEAME